MKFEIRKYLVAIVIVAIAVLAFVFTNQIYIQDAITLEVAQDFGIAQVIKRKPSRFTLI